MRNNNHRHLQRTEITNRGRTHLGPPYDIQLSLSLYPPGLSYKIVAELWIVVPSRIIRFSLRRHYPSVPITFATYWHTLASVVVPKQKRNWLIGRNEKTQNLWISRNRPVEYDIAFSRGSLSRVFVGQHVSVTLIL
jgi:hypothetical protein